MYFSTVTSPGGMFPVLAIFFYDAHMGKHRKILTHPCTESVFFQGPSLQEEYLYSYLYFFLEHDIWEKQGGSNVLCAHEENSSLRSGE
jgi:hypothetical protein